MRSGRDKKIAGVCAGVAYYLDMDPTIVRVIWGVLTCCYGAGIVAYIILSPIIHPKSKNHPESLP
ncbi:putative stress-responsive transcriptional regulator [Streptococcus pneumoniae]|nr:putative stress-responsive transcriptional regulator [Streptococcus pneumoniae]